jgi:hypothetical protein
MASRTYGEDAHGNDEKMMQQYWSISKILSYFFQIFIFLALSRCLFSTNLFKVHGRTLKSWGWELNPHRAALQAAA